MPHLTLFELNNLIRSQLETHLEPTYWVVAEISELRLNQKGHCYMELVEKEHNFIQAKIRANIWSYTYRTLSHEFETATKTKLKPGIKVLFNVSINFHEVYGMSLTVNNIDPNYTIGERSRLKEETIKRLQEAGLMEGNKVLDLPLVPQNIAVISSDSAAGYGDFMNQLKSNSHGYDFNISLFKALMQGNEAVNSIRKALKEINESPSVFDVVILIRGGGAQADLDCFDTFELGRAISLFPLPILTGIGHERDQTVADIVAHTSLKTPTAAAEFLISGIKSFDDRLHEAIYLIEKVYESKLNTERQKLLQHAYSIEQNALSILSNHSHQLKEKSLTLKHTVKRLFERQHSKIDSYKKQFELIDPQALFERGYSVTLKNGKSISNQTVSTGDVLETRALNKHLKSRVMAVEHE